MKKDLEQRFQKYHRDNPHVMDLLIKYTMILKEKGYKNYGAKAVFERIRWHLNVETKDPDGFKINNDYISRYVRLLEKIFPKYEGFYRTRKLRA